MENFTVHKTLKFKVLAILTIFAALSLGLFMYQGKTITLKFEDEIDEVVSYASNVEDFLEKEDIPLEEGGYINVPLDTKLEDNMLIIIKNPKPYTVTQGEVAREVESVYNTVEDILNDLDVKLEGKDYVTPDFDTEIRPGSNIEIFRVQEVLESEETDIPFEKLVNKSKELDIGVTKVAQEGQKGLKKTDYKKEYINGELVSTTVVNEEVVKEPVSHIVEKGTREKILVSRGSTSSSRNTNPPNIDNSKAITMNASAYDASFASTGKRPGDKYYGITASGTKVRPGVVAVDPRVIPLGTKLYIESTDGTPDYGYATAEDKGGAIKGNKIDLYFETANEVRNFGRRNVKVYILP